MIRARENGLFDETRKRRWVALLMGANSQRLDDVFFRGMSLGFHKRKTRRGMNGPLKKASRAYSVLRVRQNDAYHAILAHSTQLVGKGLRTVNSPSNYHAIPARPLGRPPLSGQNHKYRDAPRMSRRPAGKARGGRIPGVFNRRATRPVGMDRRPNAIVFMVLTTWILFGIMWFSRTPIAGMALASGETRPCR